MSLSFSFSLPLSFGYEVFSMWPWFSSGRSLFPSWGFGDHSDQYHNFGKLTPKACLIASSLTTSAAFWHRCNCRNCSKLTFRCQIFRCFQVFMKYKVASLVISFSCSSSASWVRSGKLVEEIIIRLEVWTFGNVPIALIAVPSSCVGMEQSPS